MVGRPSKFSPEEKNLKIFLSKERENPNISPL
jgi:hypothetical protein